MREKLQKKEEKNLSGVRVTKNIKWKPYKGWEPLEPDCTGLPYTIWLDTAQNYLKEGWSSPIIIAQIDDDEFVAVTVEKQPQIL